MADPTKGWHAVFDKGSKQAQEKLKKAHGHKPEFQAFLKSRGAEGGERSAKQATTSLKKATDAKIAAQKIADMRFKKALQVSSDRVREMGRRRRESGEGLGGGLESNRDIVAYVKQHGSIKAGRLGEAMDRTQLIGRVVKDAEKKKAAMQIVDRLKSASYGRGAGLNPSKDMKLNPSSPIKTDMSALSHKRHSMNYEEVQIDEVSKKEAEAMLGGPVKEKPKMPPGKQPAGYRYVRNLARKAMRGQVDTVHRSMEKTMKKEEVEQVVEQDDSMEKKEMAQTQLHFMAYAAKEILEFIDMGGEIEEWYQNKLSKVQSEVESLHSYIEGEKRRTGMVKEEEQIDEKAPPGAKYERMVKHIKAGYAKGGLTKQEKGIAYATAWKAYGKKNEEVEQVDEAKLPHVATFIPLKRHIENKSLRDAIHIPVNVAHGDKSHKEKLVKKIGAEKAAMYKLHGVFPKRVDEEVEQVDEAKAVTHEDPLVTVHDKDGIMTHANLSTANHIHGTNVKHTDVHAGPVKVKNSDNNKMTFELSKNHAKMVREEAEGKVAVTPKEKSLAAHHGDPKRITYGDVIKARLKSAAAKKMGK